jgi:hypothetical protein
MRPLTEEHRSRIRAPRVVVGMAESDVVDGARSRHRSAIE